ncbi:uncharacterized protein V1516DRAFT_671896 [Lipomyces oligophaga]|uniref:uncharacterized protein n=1 Tax=Lipomyces oligophaga TaxID=45792 RepID=UPI0034CD4D49
MLIRSYSTLVRPLRVAIVGSGPAGFYTAYRIMSKIPDGQVIVDMYERLPVPFGLSRYGVAPDHPEVKNCEEKFEEVAGSNNFRFYGNIEIGTSPKADSSGFHANSLELSVLQDNYDATVLAYGASADNQLPIPGADLEGVLSARSFVGWYNGHPDLSSLDIGSILRNAQDAVIIGHGNVALDVARMLLKPVDSLRGTDIGSHALAALAESSIRRVRIVGRRGPGQVSFTNKEVRELMNLASQDAEIDFVCAEKDAQALATLAASTGLSRVQKRFVQIIQKVPAHPTEPSYDLLPRKKAFSVEYFLSPAGFSTISPNSTHVSTAQLAETEYIPNADPVNKASRVALTGKILDIPCTAAFLSIGYDTRPLSGAEHLYTRNSESPQIAHGLYAAGWIRRGPTGVIADTMADAFMVGDLIVKDLLSSPSADGKEGWMAAKSHLQPGDARVVSWKDWKTIDAYEQQLGLQNGKVREKLVTVKSMFDILD